MPCSRMRRWTEGKRVLECGGRVCPAAGCCGAGSGAASAVEDEDSACFGRVSSFFEGVGSSLGTSRLEISSPSSARRAISLPTGTPFVPSPTCVS